MIPKTPYPILFIGGMSLNVIETIAKYSHRTNNIIPIIVSRRQVDAKELGGGYVENWNTEDFTKHISDLRQKYPRAKIPLCRDHGGPWQGYNENNLSYEKAIRNAKLSYKTDILNGFDIIHIDTSKNFDTKTSLRRAFELLQFCQKIANKHEKNIEYEIGTEDADGKIISPEEFEKFLKNIIKYTNVNDIPKPRFVVGRTGTLVKETKQVGKFDLPNTKNLLDICNKYNIGMKEHNADYDSAKNLKTRKRIGLTALNVAPEFGVIETRTFINFCKQVNRKDIVDKFVDLAYQSKRWEKWMIKSNGSRFKKSIIAGHYIFGTRDFKKLKNTIGHDVDEVIQDVLYNKIDWYMKNLRGE